MIEVELKLQPESERFRKMEFIAWKNDQKSFYAKPRNGKPRVIALVPSLPDGALWIEQPFPLEHAPAKIEPCLLLPPPCYEGVDEQEQRVDPEPWEGAWMQKHGAKFMCLTKDDEKPLSILLEEYKAAARIDYENKGEEWENHYCAPLHIENGIECSGVLNVTVGMVKRGCLGVRDSYLVKCWAKERGVDLDAMARQRGEFMRHLQQRTGSQAIISDFRGGLREKYKGVVPSKYHGEDDPEFKVLCASVKYRIEFENGNAAFLFDCTERKELRAEEWKELKGNHGIETPHTRKVAAARRKGGKVSKVKDALTKKEIVADYKKRLRKERPKTAAEGTVRWAQERFNVKVSYRTIQNYAKEAEKAEK